MKARARHYLVNGIPPGQVPDDVLASASLKPWRPAQVKNRRPFSLTDLGRLEQDPKLHTLELRRHLLWYMEQVRHMLRRNREAGLNTKQGARVLERMRHLLDQLPNPARLSEHALRPFLEDAHFPVQPKKTTGHRPKRRSLSRNKAA